MRRVVGMLQPDDLPTWNEMRIAELESRVHILLMPIIEISKSDCPASVVASKCLA